jgi:hypothetical protein
MYVCMFSIEIQTAQTISVKLGTGILLGGGKVLIWVPTPHPDPRGQRDPKLGPRGYAASTMQLGKNFINFKYILQNKYQP